MNTHDDDDGGQAFPHTWTEGSNGDYWNTSTPGLTKRDYFAAHIVAGMVSGALWNEVDTEEAARIAFEIADAMLRARAK